MAQWHWLLVQKLRYLELKSYQKQNHWKLSNDYRTDLGFSRGREKGAGTLGLQNQRHNCPQNAITEILAMPQSRNYNEVPV